MSVVAEQLRAVIQMKDAVIERTSCLLVDTERELQVNEDIECKSYPSFRNIGGTSQTGASGEKDRGI